MSDRAIFITLAVCGLLAWAALQTAVSTAYAHAATPQPFSYTATIGVGVGSTIPDATVVTIPGVRIC